MTTAPTREDLELYVIGAYDGDVAALEAHLAEDDAARAVVANEAALEGLLREAAAAATFCPGCDDIVRAERCDSCGVAIRPGGYVVERVVVSNAHGRMYVAHDVDGKQVALKELAFLQPPGADAIAAFEREAKFLRALEHPGIPRFCASFEEGRGVHTRYYLAQELVAGEPLDARLRDHWYTEAEVIDIARQVLTVLAYLQSLSPMVIHRDIKPANLIVRADGTIAVVDFGAAHAQGATVGSTTIGTFGYMPVEQMAGEVGPTTDPYALGATLLHLLTRDEPWRILQGSTLGPINVGTPVRRFLHRLVAKDPRERFPTAAAALEALKRIEQGEPEKEEVAVKQHVMTRQRGVGRTVALVVAAAAALTGAGLFGAKVLGGDDDDHISERAAPEAIEPVVAPAMRDRVPLPAPAHGVLPTMLVDLDFKSADLADVLRFLATACGLNFVVPSDIQASVTVRLVQVPCADAIESLLESRGLWYDYTPAGSLVRVAPRKQLDVEAHDARERAELQGALLIDDALPAGPTVDFDFKDAPLRDILVMLTAAGKVNLVLPDEIQGMVTIRAKDVPWTSALHAILQANGLWYRYRDNGRILRIAPRKVIDVEDHDARERLRASQVELPPGRPAPAVAESLDRAMVKAGVEQVKDQIRACAVKGKTGEVKISVSVAPDGNVTKTSIVATPDETLGLCVAHAMAQARFATTRTGGSFAYPFRF
jgi:hypothetical protein